MRQAIDVHHSKWRYDRALRWLKRDKELSETNKKAILKFTSDLQAEGIRLPRQTKYIYLLRTLGKMLRKDFQTATVQDIKELVISVNNSDYADWTKSDHRIALKRFYRWLKGLPRGKDPPETEWIRIGNSSGKQVLPEELLTEDDIQKMLEACENSRDRAFLLSVFETGGRVAEVLNLRRKHVRFDDLGAVLAFSGKTGDRPARIIQAAPALALWMNDHPDKNPDSPLWLVIGIRGHGEPMLYDGARKLLRRLAKSAGIKKRVNPHSFRHSRASYLANYMTERQMESYLGWTPGSKMPRIYVHLSGRDLDPVLSRINGIEAKQPETTQKPRFTPRICPRCHQKTGGAEQFCSSCGLPLHITAALEAEQIRKEADGWMNLLLADSDVKQLLFSKLIHKENTDCRNSTKQEYQGQTRSREVEDRKNTEHKSARHVEHGHIKQKRVVETE